MNERWGVGLGSEWNERWGLGSEWNERWGVGLGSGTRNGEWDWEVTTGQTHTPLGTCRAHG